MRPTPTIATLTLNPAIDHTAGIPDFAVGEVNRVADDQTDAGGKGVNVAAFLSHFDVRVAATGLLGRENSDAFERLFSKLRINDRFVWVDGRTRVNVKIIDPSQNQTTDINFPGLVASQSSVDVLKETALTLVDEGVNRFVLAGSLPSGVPAGIYGELIPQLKQRGCRVYLDTSGDALAQAIGAGPHIVKPNIAELSDLVGKPLNSIDEIIGAARGLANGQIERTVVSMGAYGALFITQDRALMAIPPQVHVRSSVGAGDAMVAGLVYGEENGLELEEIARLSTAFSLGTLGQIGPRLPEPADVRFLAQDVVIQDL